MISREYLKIEALEIKWTALSPIEKLLASDDQNPRAGINKDPQTGWHTAARVSPLPVPRAPSAQPCCLQGCAPSGHWVDSALAPPASVVVILPWKSLQAWCCHHLALPPSYSDKVTLDWRPAQWPHLKSITPIKTCFQIKSHLEEPNFSTSVHFEEEVVQPMITGAYFHFSLQPWFCMFVVGM